MITSPAIRGGLQGVFLLLGFTSILLFSSHRGLSNPSHGPIIDNQDHQSTSSLKHQHLFKRDAAADYAAALRTGEQMWAKIQAAYDGCARDPVQNFPISDLDNGWTKSTLHIALDAPWRAYIDLELGQGKVPPADQTPFVELTQDKEFRNKQGATRPALSATGLEPARYRTYYIPAVSAVIIKNMRSPATVVKEIFRQAKQPNPPSNAVITNVYTPPLSRWSDVTWTVFQDLASTAQKAKLQFIGHDQVNNAFSAGVMVYIIRKHQQQGNPNARPSLPFPGMEFGIETEEGKALLGTPNGLGTAWLLYDRGGELGRRGLKVRIWIEGRDKLMMAFNMVPV